MSDDAFLNLPIRVQEKREKDGLTQWYHKDSTIGEILKTWNIDDESERDEMTQVLRHLRRVMR